MSLHDSDDSDLRNESGFHIAQSIERQAETEGLSIGELLFQQEAYLAQCERAARHLADHAEATDERMDVQLSLRAADLARALRSFRAALRMAQDAGEDCVIILRGGQ